MRLPLATGARMKQARNGRRGAVFPLRLTDEERSELERYQAATAGPLGLGPWLLWAARQAAIARVLPARALERVLPPPALSAPRPGNTEPGRVLPALRAGPAVADRVVLDLCSGSGAWSEPYRRAGYRVVCVDATNGADVRLFTAPSGVHGVLAAPPCTEFSLAKNGRERNLVLGLELVSACLRIIVGVRPKWWALENPVGLLSRYLGTPLDVWEPYEFGDPWTKRTAVWGEFKIPERGPFVEATGSAMDRRTPAARAITPPGFARAFFEANP